MKYLEYVAIAIALVGAILNHWNLAFGDLFVIIGLGLLALIYGLTGSIFSKIQKQRGSSLPFIVFFSVTLSAGVLSLLFSHMHWELRGILAIYSYVALPVGIIINLYLLSQKSENPLNKMFLIRAILLLLALIIF